MFEVDEFANAVIAAGYDVPGTASKPVNSRIKRIAMSYCQQWVTHPCGVWIATSPPRPCRLCGEMWRHPHWQYCIDCTCEYIGAMSIFDEPCGELSVEDKG